MSYQVAYAQVALSLRDPCFSLRGSQTACKAYASLLRVGVLSASPQELLTRASRTLRACLRELTRPRPCSFPKSAVTEAFVCLVEVATAPSMSPKSSQSKFCWVFLMVRTCGLRRLPAAKVLRASCQVRLGCNSTSHQKTHEHMWDNSSEHACKAYQAITKKSLRRCLRNMFPQKVLTPAYAVQAFAYAGPCYDTTLLGMQRGCFRAAQVSSNPSFQDFPEVFP